MKALLSLAALLCAASLSLAENWPQFRGPTGQGISSEKNLPRHWSASSNVVWKTAIDGESWSSPVVWGGHIFATTATESGTKCRVLAIDGKTGSILWQKEVFEQVPRRKEGKNSYASPTPVTDGELVYTCFGDGSFAALDFSGNVVWTNREHPFYSQHGLGASPILYQDILIMPRDASSDGEDKKVGWQKPWDQGYVLALDKKTGRQRWKGARGLSRIAHATPLIVQENGQDRLISIAGDVVQSFDLKTGERLWSAFAQGEGLVPTPVAGGGLLFSSSGYEKTTLRAIRLGGQGDVTQSHIAWEQRKGVPTQPSLLYLKPHVYAITDGGVATCYRESDGEIVWQERVGGNFSASPVFADGHIYFLSEAGETVVIEPGAEFKIVARNPLEGFCQASMAVSNGRLFIRTDKNLYCIGQ